MQIQVKCGCGAADCSDWALLELQGSLEIQPSAQHLPLQNLVIGSLCHAKEDKFYFTVGYHELEGKKLPLKKPLLVLRKNNADVPMDVESTSGTPATQFAKQDQGIELEVIGIIRHKLLFKNRPKALISKPEVKGKKLCPSLEPVIS